MEEDNKKPMKRGRKAKTVNFEGGSGKQKELPEMTMDEPSVLKIPVDIETLIKKCDYPENCNEIQQLKEGTNYCNHIVPINQSSLDGITSELKTIAIKDENKSRVVDSRISLKNDTENIKEYTETCKKTGNTIHVKVSENKALRESLKGEIIAEKTRVSCWWCCHPFDDYPVCAPEKYDELRDVFKVKGCFCSFNCAKAFMKNERNPSIYLCKSYIKRLLGYVPDIIPAPSRYTLKMFGGPLSIEEFRNTFTGLSSVSFNVYPMVYFPTQIEHRISRPSGSSINKAKQKSSFSETPGKEHNFLEDHCSSSSVGNQKRSRVITKQNIEVSASRVKKNIEKINKQPKKSLLSLMSIKVSE